MCSLSRPTWRMSHSSLHESSESIIWSHRSPLGYCLRKSASRGRSCLSQHRQSDSGSNLMVDQSRSFQEFAILSCFSDPVQNFCIRVCCWGAQKPGSANFRHASSCRRLARCHPTCRVHSLQLPHFLRASILQSQYETGISLVLKITVPLRSTVMAPDLQLSR